VHSRARFADHEPHCPRHMFSTAYISAVAPAGLPHRLTQFSCRADLHAALEPDEQPCFSPPVNCRLAHMASASAGKPDQSRALVRTACRAELRKRGTVDPMAQSSHRTPATRRRVAGRRSTRVGSSGGFGLLQGRSTLYSAWVGLRNPRTLGARGSGALRALPCPSLTPAPA